MNAAWTVRDNNGHLLADFAAGSRIEVGRKLVPQRYDAFRLHVSASYRELFERALSQILQRNGWEIVRIRPQRTASCAASAPIPALAPA